MYVQKRLVVPLIWDPRNSLTDVWSDLREPARDEDEANVLQARATLLPYVQTLLKDFDSRWDVGSDDMIYKESQKVSYRAFVRNKSW